MVQVNLFRKRTPKPEISRRDLPGGGGLGVKIPVQWVKKMGRRWLEDKQKRKVTFSGTSREISPQNRYQNVDLGLSFQFRI